MNTTEEESFEIPRRERSIFSAIRLHSAFITIIVVLGMLGILIANGSGSSVTFLMLVFFAGAVGGITNNFIRLRDVPSMVSFHPDKYTNALAIIQIYVTPIIAGVFGLLTYGLFAAGIFDGPLVPQFAGAAESYENSDSSFFQLVYPNKNIDVARCFVWSFFAGFAERLIPNIIDRIGHEMERNVGPKNAKR